MQTLFKLTLQKVLKEIIGKNQLKETNAFIATVVVDIDDDLSFVEQKEIKQRKAILSEYSQLSN